MATRQISINLCPADNQLTRTQSAPRTRSKSDTIIALPKRYRGATLEMLVGPTSSQKNSKLGTIEATIAALETANLEGLREQWRRRYGTPPPLRSEMLLRNVLAWRIQADALGGLDAQTRKLLRDGRPPREPIVVPGTIIRKLWRGISHEIEATGNGFLYDGKRWESLSEIATAITGTRWNGPRFFGLREKRK